MCDHTYRELGTVGIVQCPFDHAPAFANVAEPHLGHFQCDACAETWPLLPGADVTCRDCGSVYLSWLDHQRFADERARVYAGWTF